MPGSRSLVEGAITLALNPASATETLMVEHGWKPLLVAILWFTMARMRPVMGSTATTDPLYEPSASTAARRMVRSSPSTRSPTVESA